MKIFLALVSLLTAMTVPAPAQVQGPAMRSTNGTGFGTTTIGGRLIVTNVLGTNYFSGKLGIGTNSPVAKLDVQGTGNVILNAGGVALNTATPNLQGSSQSAVTVGGGIGPGTQGQWDNPSVLELTHATGMADGDNKQVNEIDWTTSSSVNTGGATKQKIVAFEIYTSGTTGNDRGGKFLLDTKQDGGVLANALIIDNQQNSLFNGGQVLLKSGTVSSPGIAFQGSTSSGLWLSGSYDVNLTVAGTNALKATTNRFASLLPFSDFTSGGVGMGTFGSASYALFVNKSISAATVAAAPVMRIDNQLGAGNFSTITFQNSGTAGYLGYINGGTDATRLMVVSGSGGNDLIVDAIGNVSARTNLMVTSTKTTIASGSANTFVVTNGNVGFGTATPGVLGSSQGAVTISGGIGSGSSVLELVPATGMTDGDQKKINEIDWVVPSTINTGGATKQKIVAIEAYLSGPTANDRGGYFTLDTKQDGGVLVNALIVDRFQNAKFNGGQVLLKSGTVESPALAFQSATNTGLWLSGNHDLNVTVGGTNAATIKTNRLAVNLPFTDFTAGGVGVGTTGSGSYALHVRKDIAAATVSSAPVMRIENQLAAGNFASITFENGTSAGKIGYVDGGSDAARMMVLSGSGSSDLTVNALGNVGIGTAAALSTLHMQAQSPTLILKSTNANDYAGTISFRDSNSTEGIIEVNYFTHDMIFTVQSVEVARMKSTGNVGIGTNAPASKLDVKGTALVDALAFRTNTFPVSPNFAAGVQLFATNAAFTFLAPAGVDTTMTQFQETRIYVTNNGASPFQVTAPANVHTLCTWWVTNLTEFKFQVYGSKFTNAAAINWF